MKNLYVNEEADLWYASLPEDFGKFPFSFLYRGKKYKGFSAADFTLKNKAVDKAEGKEKCSYVFDFADGIEITLILTHYFSHGVTEWTVWFENTSAQNSGVLEALQTELCFQGKYPTLKGILGDHVNQYSPYCVDMQNNEVEFSSESGREFDSGRATHVTFPYFNLEYGDGGVMLAIGWAGTWKARFSSDKDKCMYTASSINGLRTYLKPQEKLRTALFVVAPYAVRNEHYATNFWRSWFVEHNLPKADAQGNALEPFSTCSLTPDTGLPNSDGSISERYTTWRPTFEKMLSEKVKVDFRWFDAGWYVCPDGTSAEPFMKGHDWWDTVGTWDNDPVKWPGKTFRESTDFARANGMKTLVWFEPERVTDPENLAKNYGYDIKWAIRMDGVKSIANNLGDPECLAWTTERVCKMLRENKVELYREDNNCDNEEILWKHLDCLEGEDRCGITEAKVVYGHYKLWDDIIACTLSYGGCGFVDSCAAGGGRNDLESMRRGVPLFRSDSDRTSTALRLSMTSTFNKWLPFCGASSKEKKEELDVDGVSDKYVWRASYLPALNVHSRFVHDETQNFDILRFGIAEWKRVAPYLLKDFYPLTPWHKERDTTDFTAFCFYDAQKEAGVLLAFRQEDCAKEVLRVLLPFAGGDEEYTVTDEDTGEKYLTNGRLEICFEAPRTAKLLWLAKK